MRREARKVDVEVLPPERPGEAADPLMQLIANLMDNAFRLPGTNRRFGLDPLLGLLPGLGDTVGGLISAVLIAKGARHGLPKVVLARMALNVLLNSGIGAVPGVGDAFSFWFKSNARNYRLFEKHRGARRAATTSDWLFVGALLGGLVIVFILAAAGLIVLLGALKQASGI